MSDAVSQKNKEMKKVLAKYAASTAENLEQFLRGAFDVKRYDDCKSLKATDWSNILFFRHMVRIYFKGFLTSESEKGKQIALDYLTRLIERPLPDERASWPATLKANWSAVFEPEDDYFLSETDRKVVVRLEATDDAILMEFRSWLRATRLGLKAKREYAVPARFTAAEMKRWSSMHVLAYIDLEGFAMMLGGTITQKPAGDLLFPDERSADLTERVRKTVIPLAKQLMSFDFLEALQAHAAANVKAAREGS